MKTCIRLLSPIAIVAALSIGCTAAPPSEGSFAFVNVNVVPMDSESILENYTVVVRGTRIVEMGPAASITLPDGTTTIDGQGKYLMPGLAEMHGHIPPVDGTPASETYASNTLFLYVAGGVTTVRGMLGGQGHLDLRRKANSGEIVSPTLYLAGPSMHGSNVDSPEHARERVRAIKEEGWDLIKVHEALTPEEYNALAETAHEVGIRFGGHVTNEVSIVHAFAMGQETFDHMDGYLAHAHGDGESILPDRLAELVELTEASGAWVVPTISLLGSVWSVTPLETMQAYPEMAYVSKEQFDGWTSAYEATRSSENYNYDQLAGYIRDLKQILIALNRGGGRILLGSDAPQRFSVPGFSLQHEMAAMADGGMTPYEIYRTGTYNPGQYFQRSDTFGTVAVGRRADLVLLDADPLASIENFKLRSGVMVRGQWLSKTDIQRRLDEISASQAHNAQE